MNRTTHKNVSRSKTYPASMLRRAAHAGNLDVVLDLLRDKIHVDAPQADGCTAVWLASEKGHTTVVRTLCEHGADVNATKHAGRVSPLYIAAQNGHLDVVRILLLYGASIDQAKSTGATPLFIAGQQNHFEIVQTLLEAGGADIEHQNHMGITPLMIAAYQGNTSTVHLLLRYGADPCTLGGGRNAFQWAECGGHSEKLHNVFQAYQNGRICPEGSSQHNETKPSTSKPSLERSSPRANDCSVEDISTMDVNPIEFGLVTESDAEKFSETDPKFARSSKGVLDPSQTMHDSNGAELLRIEQEWKEYKGRILNATVRAIPRASLSTAMMSDSGPSPRVAPRLESSIEKTLVSRDAVEPSSRESITIPQENCGSNAWGQTFLPVHTVCVDTRLDSNTAITFSTLEKPQNCALPRNSHFKDGALNPHAASPAEPPEPDAKQNDWREEQWFLYQKDDRSTTQRHSSLLSISDTTRESLPVYLKEDFVPVPRSEVAGPRSAMGYRSPNIQSSQTRKFSNPEKPFDFYKADATLNVSPILSQQNKYTFKYSTLSESNKEPPLAPHLDPHARIQGDEAPAGDTRPVLKYGQIPFVQTRYSSGRSQTPTDTATRTPRALAAQRQRENLLKLLSDRRAQQQRDLIYHKL